MIEDRGEEDTQLALLAEITTKSNDSIFLNRKRERDNNNNSRMMMKSSAVLLSLLFFGGLLLLQQPTLVVGFQLQQQQQQRAPPQFKPFEKGSSQTGRIDDDVRRSTTTTTTTRSSFFSRRTSEQLEVFRIRSIHHRRRTLLLSLQLSSSTSANDDNNEDNLSEKKQQQQSTTTGQRRRKRSSVFAILMASFLNLLGFTMAGPITPALGKHFSLTVGASFGSLTSAYPFGMLFGLFLWPRLSDKIGRKPIMTLSLVGSGLGLLLQSVSILQQVPLTYFLAARALTGTFAGSSPVSKAYLADVGYKDGKLPRYLALRDAASTMAFIVGPVLGGILYDLRARAMRIMKGSNTQLSTASSLAFTIGISAAASLLAALFVGIFVQEVSSSKTSSDKPKTTTTTTTTKSDKKQQEEVDDAIIDNEIIEEEEEELISCPLGTRMWTGVASVCVVSFLFNIGDSTFHAFFSALLKDGAHLATRQIGLLYTALACISFTVSTTTTSYILKTFGPVAACAIGLGFIGSGLTAFGIAAWPAIGAIQPHAIVLALAASIYYCGVPLYGPSIPTMLLRCVPSSKRGSIMGLDGTINTFGRIISPLIMGEVYRRFGAGAAFGLAGGLVFVGMITALFRRFVVLRNSYNN